MLEQDENDLPFAPASSLRKLSVGGRNVSGMAPTPTPAKAVAVAADLVGWPASVETSFGLVSEPTVWERQLAARMAQRDCLELVAAGDDDWFDSRDLCVEDAALVECLAAAGRAEADALSDIGGSVEPAGVDLAAEMAVGVDPWLGRDGMVLAGQVLAADRAERAAQAAGLVALAELAEVTSAREIASSGVVDPDFLTAIVATTLGVGPRVAATRVDDAVALTSRLPRTLAGLAGGWLSMRAAHTMVAETVQVADALVDTVEAAVFDALARTHLHASDQPLGSWEAFDLHALVVFDPALGETLSSVATPARLRTLCRRVVKTVDAAAVARREEAARARADVRVWADEAGMSWLGALVPDADAAAVYHRINTDAHAQARTEGEFRSIGQIRADLLIDSLLGPRPDGTPGPAINLTVHLDPDGAVRVDHVGDTTSATLNDLINLARRTHPAPTEAGVGGGKASVAGPGRSPDDYPGGWASVPPPAPTPRPAGVRVLQPAQVTCPGVHDGPGPRFASPQLAAAVVARDRTCRFPGCAVPALDCDLDHAVPHPHGPTCICNLICLCRRHHRTKTFAPGWRVIHHGQGRTTWITPTGQTITTDPDPPLDPGD